MTEPTELNERDQKIYNLLVDGLLTDGGHHKQYYVERAALLLFGEDDLAITAFRAKLASEKIFSEDSVIPDDVEDDGEYYTYESGIPA